MDKISVIMSTYNEEMQDIRLSVQSIINQTFKNIEIIIVNDNPNREDVEDYIRSLNKDNIIYIKNKENIGLAMSMNIAAKYASGVYLARMDADDISYVDRLEKELNFLKENDYDYVCTQYEYIDENGVRLDINAKKWHNPGVNMLLPYGNTIHHPTVLMKKDIFEAVGGYRCFPCAQDYDLWLRLFENGYRVGILEEVLLKYRVRQNSITSVNKFKPIITLLYMQELYKKRKRGKNDNFSLDDYKAFLCKHRMDDDKYINKTVRYKSYKENMDKEKEKKFIYILRLIRLMIVSRYYRTYYKYVIRINIKERLINDNKN